MEVGGGRGRGDREMGRREGWSGDVISDFC